MLLQSMVLGVTWAISVFCERNDHPGWSSTFLQEDLTPSRQLPLTPATCVTTEKLLTLFQPYFPHVGIGIVVILNLIGLL